MWRHRTSGTAPLSSNSVRMAVKLSLSGVAHIRIICLVHERPVTSIQNSGAAVVTGCHNFVSTYRLGDHRRWRRSAGSLVFIESTSRTVTLFPAFACLADAGRKEAERSFMRPYPTASWGREMSGIDRPGTQNKKKPKEQQNKSKKTKNAKKSMIKIKITERKKKKNKKNKNRPPILPGEGLRKAPPCRSRRFRVDAEAAAERGSEHAALCAFDIGQ